MPGRRTPPWQRERLGHESPGAVLRGPPIVVACECGQKRDLAYGERWTCGSCGRTYDTKRIPRRDYEAIRRTQMRFRVLPVALGIFVAGLAIFFTLTGNTFSVFLLLPLALTAVFILMRPVHRDPAAEEMAIASALEAGAPLIVANVVRLPPYPTTVCSPGRERPCCLTRRTSRRCGRRPSGRPPSASPPSTCGSRRSAPVKALLEVVRERDAGLLVFGPDLRRIRRRRFRRAAAQVRRDAACLVWVAPDG